MFTTDWSVRYLWLGVFSTTGTILTLFTDNVSTLFAAFVTSVAFATLALFHAYRLRTHSWTHPQKTDRVP